MGESILKIQDGANLYDLDTVIVGGKGRLNVAQPDGANATLGAKADAAVTDPALSASEIALLKGLLTLLGQKTDAAVTDPTLAAGQIQLLKGLLKQLQGGGTGAAPVTLNGSNPTLVIPDTQQRCFRVLRAADTGGLCNDGVGTPYVIVDPDDTKRKWLLFTGWNTDQIRKIYIADIADDFKISNIRLLLAPSDLGTTDLKSVSAIWDDYNAQWILATSKDAVTTIWFAFFNRDFTTRISTQTVDLAVTLTDSGASLIPLGSKELLFTVCDAVNVATPFMRLYKIADMTARPLGAPTLAMLSSSITGAVHHTFILNDTLTTIYERFLDSAWSLGIAFGPQGAGWRGQVGQFEFTPSSRFLSLPNMNDEITSFGHPHFTTYFGSPTLLFAWFRTWNHGGPRNHAHEIWAQTLPDDYLKPRNWFPFYLQRNLDGTAGGESGLSPYSVATHGAKKVVVWAGNPTATGTLQIREAPYIVSNSAKYIKDDFSVTAATNARFVIADPLLHIRPRMAALGTVELGLLMLD